MRERRRDRPPEPPEPTKAPPPAPKPKPHPRGPPSVEDDLSEKGKADSVNDSFEDIPEKDRRSKIERIHGVPTPLSAVLQKSMEKSDHEDHEEDSNSHGPPGYSTDDPERREVGTRPDIVHTNLSMPDIGIINHSLPDNINISTPDIDHTNQSLYVFSYPSSIDSNMSEICGDYDASKPLSAHRQRTSSASDMPRSSRFKSDNLHNSVADIPQAYTGRQYEKYNGPERFYTEKERVKRGKNPSKENTDKQVEQTIITQPTIYGRRSKHFVQNQKQRKFSQKVPTSQPSLQTVAMSSLIPGKGPNAKTQPLYAKINKDLKQSDKTAKIQEKKMSPIKLKSSNSLPYTDALGLKAEELSPETNRERIHEELKMYILTPQTKETIDMEQRTKESFHENKQLTKDIIATQTKEISKVDEAQQQCDSPVNERKLSSKVTVTDGESKREEGARNDTKLETDLTNKSDAKEKTEVEGLSGSYGKNVSFDENENKGTKPTSTDLRNIDNIANNSTQPPDIAYNANADEDDPMTDNMSNVLPLLKRSNVKHDTSRATREWINNIDTSYGDGFVEEAENKISASGVMISGKNESHTHVERNDIFSNTHCSSSTTHASKGDVTSDVLLPLSPAIVVSDCGKEQDAKSFISPYQLVFDSTIKVTLNTDGQEIDFDTQLERFSNLSSESSDIADTLRVDNDEKLERFSTVSSESSDLELKYGGKAIEDKDISLEKFCSLSTDSSEGDVRVSDAYCHGAHLSIPTKVLRKRHKKKPKESDVNLENKKTLKSSERSNSMEIELKENGLYHKKNEDELHKNKNQGVKSPDSMAKDSLSENKDYVSIKTKQKLDTKPLPSNNMTVPLSEQSSLEQRSEDKQDLKKMKHHKSKDKLESSENGPLDKQSSIAKYEEKTTTSQPLKKIKSKEKLGSGFSCMKTRTTSPFEGHVAAEDRYHPQEEVKTEKSKSVYQKVATQLSKPFGKRKSTDKLQGEDESINASRRDQINEASDASKVESPGRSAPQNEIDKTAVIDNQPRKRFSKPDWFKTYLLPDEQKSSSTADRMTTKVSDLDKNKANVIKERKLDMSSQAIASEANDRLSRKAGGFESEKEPQSDIHKDEASGGSKRQASKRKECHDSNSELDQMKVGKLSKKKVSPGIIHMLNPCPSGWIEGGLEIKLNTEERRMWPNEKTTDLVDTQGAGDSKIDNTKRKVQVSALDFELTKCPSTFDNANTFKQEDVNRPDKTRSNEVADDKDDNVLYMPHSLSTFVSEEVTSIKPKQASVSHQNVNEPVDITKHQLVEDKLCQRKWKYMPFKTRCEGLEEMYPVHASQKGEIHTKESPFETIKLKEVSETNDKETSEETIKQNILATKGSQNVPAVKSLSLIHTFNKDTCTEGAIDRIERKIVVDCIAFSRKPKETTSDELCNNEIRVSSEETKSDILHKAKPELFSNDIEDPLDDGSIPFADEEVADIALQEIKANNEIPEENDNTQEINESLEDSSSKELNENIENSKCPESSLDKIICECNFRRDKTCDKTGTIMTISSKSSRRFLTEGSVMGQHSECDINKIENTVTVIENDKIAVRPHIACNDEIASASINETYMDEVNVDQMCSDETGGTILCECNFKSVPVTDLDGASWYEKDDEIETVCSYTDDRVPVIIDESPFVPKKRILKSSYSADNLTKGSNKKGVRFHANLPTWKKRSWRSESNLRRTKTVYEDDEMDKKRYIENFIMCLFEQEPRNRSLGGDEFSGKGYFGKEESEGNNINMTESHLENSEYEKQKPSLQISDFANAGVSKLADNKSISMEGQGSKHESLWAIKHNCVNNSYDAWSKPSLQATAEIDPDSVSSDPFGTLDTIRTGNDDNLSASDLNSLTKFKQPTVIAKQPKPHGPKFFVPVSHSRLHSTLAVSPSFDQIKDTEISNSYQEKYESYQLPFSKRLETAAGVQNPSFDNINSPGDLETSKITIIDATTCDVTTSEILRPKPLTDWLTYLKSYEKFRKKMDSSVDKTKNDERIENKTEFNRIHTNNPNVDNYADVSLINSSIPISSVENNQISGARSQDLPVNKAAEILESCPLEAPKTEMVKFDADTQVCYPESLPLVDENLKLLQLDESYSSEYGIGRNVTETNTDICHAVNGSVVSKAENLSNDEVVPDSPSTFPGKTTRYIVTLPDESDPESPRIKSVTYEYITEYRLNKVKVDYQHSKKVQTEREPLTE